MTKICTPILYPKDYLGARGFSRALISLILHPSRVSDMFLHGGRRPRFLMKACRERTARVPRENREKTARVPRIIKDKLHPEDYPVRDHINVRCETRQIKELYLLKVIPQI